MNLIDTINNNGETLVLVIVAVAIAIFGPLIFFKWKRRPSRLEDFGHYISLLTVDNGCSKAWELWKDGDHIIRYYGGVGVTRKEYHNLALSSLERHIEWLEERKQEQQGKSQGPQSSDPKAIDGFIKELDRDRIKLIARGLHVPDDKPRQASQPV
jgi:hypothetical protein